MGACSVDITLFSSSHTVQVAEKFPIYVFDGVEKRLLAETSWKISFIPKSTHTVSRWKAKGIQKLPPVF
jgi:hypothetical protein